MPISTGNSRPRLGTLAGGMGIAALLLVVGAAGWFWWAARSALPALDGRLQIAGLSSSVRVLRDAHGIPTIEAANLDDLFFAQGYVTASDRLFQMDGMRRFAAGELSEVLGQGFLEHDRQQRILGLRVAAEKSVHLMSASERARCDAYARGVNAYIESHRQRLPLEFRLLRYAPRAWSAVDSLLVAVQMVADLSTTPRNALFREKILARLGPDLTADLYVNSSPYDRPPLMFRPSNGKRDDQDGPYQPADGVPGSSVALRNPPARWGLGMMPAEAGARDAPPVVGSNNWVVSGAHTVSGRPLLSNDMHLGHQMPNLWYEAHLESADYDVAGVTLPGLPYVVAGHNQRIAWGFTNLGPTVEDAYVETFDQGGQYLTPEGWKPAEHRQEVIKIKHLPDVVVDVVLTRHGPIISQLFPGETRKIALRWTLYDGIHSPFFGVNSAANWAQFRQALSQFDAPAQNVVYADVDGNIGYQATGRIPLRASGDGSLPEVGSGNQNEWIGYVPFDQLPSVFNPPWGILATANGRVTSNTYAYSLSTEWDAPWRSARIYQVLESGKKFSASDMLALQMDIYSEFDHRCAERFALAVEKRKLSSPRALAAARILEQWDGRMTADAAAPSIEVRARKELVRLLLEPKLGRAVEAARPGSSQPSATSYSWPMQSIWLENILRDRPPRWLPSAYASYEDLLGASVEAAVNAPDAPKILASWDWGALNAIDIRHPIFGQIPILRRWAGPGMHPQAGSPYTLKAVSPDHGPSERMTVDLSNWDESTLNLVTGEAGNFLSPYATDQWTAWYEGSTFRLEFSPGAVANARSHELLLEPRPQASSPSR